jgi:RNA polymerase sigma-70 factor (ECF subfamily)
MSNFALESDLFISMDKPKIQVNRMIKSENNKDEQAEASAIKMQQIVTINKAKFEEVFRDYYDGLFRYCNTMITEKEEVEDIVQNVFVDLWQQRDKLQIHTSLQAYLYKSVFFKCLNRLKHDKVVRKYQDLAVYQESTVESDPVIIKEVAEKIKITTESLPEQCRKIFLMSRQDGLKYNEIAQALGLSPKTIENQMGKALKTMRNALVEYLNLIILTISSFL